VIKVRIRVRSETRDFAVVVCADNLQRAAQSVSECYPGSTVEIAFPIEPEQFFAEDPHPSEYVDLEVGERMGASRGRSS
jgi:hypothetical protein